jgi:hypothetical protein
MSQPGRLAESYYLQAMEGQNALLNAICDAQHDLQKVSDRLSILQESAASLQLASDCYKDKQMQINKQVARILINMRFLQDDLKSLQKLQVESGAPSAADKASAVERAVTSMQAAAASVVASRQQTPTSMEGKTSVKQ